MSIITVLVAEGHTLFREALSIFLNHTPGLEVIGEAGSGEEAVEKACSLQPRVVLLDLNLRGLTGPEVTAAIRHKAPEVQVLVLSLYTRWPLARAVLRRGAAGFVTKTSPQVELVAALFQVAAGARYLCCELREKCSGAIHPEASGVSSLTPREREVVALLQQGASSRAVAAALHLSIKTVEAHRHHILKKLKLRSTAALINLIYQQGRDE